MGISWGLTDVWRRLFLDNLNIKVLSLALALALVYVQWQRQLIDQFKGNIKIVADNWPAYLEAHPEQPALRGSFTIRGPQTAVRHVAGDDFRFKIDIEALELTPHERTRVVPITKEMLTTSLPRSDIFSKLEMLEGSQFPSQIELRIIPAKIDEPVPKIPPAEDGVTTYALIQLERAADVYVDINGEPAGGNEATVQFSPSEVILRGKRAALETILSVTAAPLSIEGVSESFDTETEIVLFGQEAGVQLIDPATGIIQVHVEIRAPKKRE